MIIALYGCATKQTFAHSLTYRTYEVFVADSHFMLHIAKNANVYHFAMFDVFGTPVVSRVFESGRFKNDKFLAPNTSFDSLFLMILNNPGIKQVEQNNIKAVAVDLSE